MEAVELAPTLRPVLESGEKIVCVQNKVGLYKGSERDEEHDSGTAYLTTHRIVYVDQERPRERSVGVDLSQVQRCSLNSGFLYTSSKISLYLHSATAMASGSGRRRSSATAGRPQHGRSDSSSSASEWKCTICGCANKGGAKCTLCGVPRVGNSTTADAQSVEQLQRCGVCTFDNHESMAQCEMCGADLLVAAAAADVSVADAQLPLLGAEGDTVAMVIKLSFRAGGASGFHASLKDALAGQAWATSPLVEPTESSVAGDGRRAAGGGGISTILSAAHESERVRDATLQSAFADLDALTAKAKEIVGMAEHLATQLHGGKHSPEHAFRQYLLDLGIDSPVTRDTAGAVFHSELARELCDYLEHYVAQCGGSVALVDAYCLYNRAREFSPVFPSDFAQACRKFADLSLPLRLREYPSGLLVLEDAASADDALVLARVDSYIASFGPLTASDLAAIEDCPLALAEERLWLAERHARVCRDEAVEGVRFYENRFHPVQ
ncbi:Vacuolar protein-sorting-associated protein 36 [Coemansia sp. RSA 2337]|nr:Vacuolar protein-sorting-associated protein 36 [Coemansia sp. S3946]KAJ2047804.1 Vacuolar protein-sorting-associated protein 36 [Coemansia sp. S16]KAJ2067548.1 Vacuolar protein-sorting-associated protein 36 [Coemansia sp. S155-1]KAJ2114666.1 Vacuolar protein-sorting-associated protein 36 [Coemansia sp. RSA 922]KAJ2335553.1 Vacuolar protein-sorting-associated protein 36 [Coemansia sp. RSA 2673]KAJ2442485.1 Vacuolar protein-sorting-associated protein 36 [Coemansia sp. RSA 2337]